ncbi:Uncharacterised protein [Chryseobacterium nakagawai]|uniref:Uncharacterized protein n=1 Tax=Chryseobacterium nakagawai TaxID=1241982 RepID=A0AAD0YLK9_CHRNA|nr:hypothetical protein [Chryseobacterium nakagawai]AZA91139.1 hypothetical protein EG343_11110 [Chryseobacterium nakagawai]VEH22699.1 Uncharacterised protein [Chryseobacterium nakagawai]
MEYKIGSLVKFNVVTDDSGWATDKWDVEPQLNKWITEIYTEELFGEIVRRNTIEVINSSGKRTGRFYRIQNGIIQSESQKLRSIRDSGMDLDDIFEGSDLKTVKDFQTITQVSLIELSTKWEHYSCLNEFPPIGRKVNIWEKQNIGCVLKESAYFDGIWKDCKTNEPIEHFTENHQWQVTKRRIFIDGQIFIQENI